MPTPRSTGILLLACACVVAAVPARAQTRPLLTETARTAPARTLVLETGMDFIADQPNFLSGVPHDRRDGPIVRLVWSPADSVELDLEWVSRVSESGDPSGASDFGDVSLRAKARLIGSADSPAVLSARFAVALPQTAFAEGLGPNTLRFSAQLLLSRRLGRAEVIANAGLALLDEPLRLHEQRDLLAYGLALTVPVGRVTALAEVTGLAGDGSPGADARSEVRAGVSVPAGRATLDAALRRGLTDADGTWGATAGISWRFR